jgi:hypothetical protein
MLLFLALYGCGSKDKKSESESNSGIAFLNERKQVPPRIEWTREIGSRNDGTIRVKITSQAPFSFTIVTAKGYRELQKGGQNPIPKTEIILTVDSTGTSLERSVKLPSGSSYIIIENASDKNVELHLECFNS